MTRVPKIFETSSGSIDRQLAIRTLAGYVKRSRAGLDLGPLIRVAQFCDDDTFMWAVLQMFRAIVLSILPDEMLDFIEDELL